jgi:hypothetical protein
VHATPDNPRRCPVAAMRMYMEKLPAQHKMDNCFFPYALDRFTEEKIGKREGCTTRKLAW